MEGQQGPSCFTIKAESKQTLLGPSADIPAIFSFPAIRVAFMDANKAAEPIILQWETGKSMTTPLQSCCDTDIHKLAAVHILWKMTAMSTGTYKFEDGLIKSATWDVDPFTAIYLSLLTRYKDSHVVELPPKPWPKKKRSFLNPSGRYEQFEHEKGLARHLTKLHLNDKRVSGHSLKKNETNILGYKKELKIVIRAACPSKISIEWKVQKKSTEVHVADGSDESGEEDDDA